MSAWKKLLAADNKPPQRTSGDPWAQAAASARPTGLHEGFDASGRSHRFTAAWTWAKRIAVGMLLVAGVIQLVIKPVRNVLADDTAPAASVERIDLVAAGATATGFALDYLSYGGPAGQAHRSAALEQWLYPDAFGQPGDVGEWSGDAVLLADSAAVQHAEAVGDDAAVVAVQVRLRTFTPADDSSASGPEAAAPPAAGSPAFTPSVPAGYVPGPAYWVRLAVPVMTAGNQPLVTAPGPVFTADDITPVPVTVESDARASEDLAPAAETVLAAYAAGDLQYVAAPDADLSGLNAEVSISELSAVRVSSVTNSDGSRNVAADVQWSLAGAAASITQTYGLQLRGIDTSAPQLQHVSVLTPIRPNDS